MKPVLFFFNEVFDGEKCAKGKVIKSENPQGRVFRAMKQKNFAWPRARMRFLI